MIPADSGVFLVTTSHGYALDEQGTLLWMTLLDADVRPNDRLCHVLDDRLLIAGDRGAMALDTSTGGTIWVRDDFHGIRQAAPAPSEGLYLILADQTLIALGAEDGRTRWTRALSPVVQANALCPATVVNDFLFVCALETDRNWHVQAIPVSKEGSPLRDPTPLRTPIALGTNGRHVFAFGLYEIRAYDSATLAQVLPVNPLSSDCEDGQ